ncbi:MAG: hypothetical protein IPG50_18690 [Myxococcales bacterium]|nr:hypothetical protein [Myxococcales bacterium]
MKAILAVTLLLATPLVSGCASHASQRAAIVHADLKRGGVCFGCEAQASPRGAVAPPSTNVLPPPRETFLAIGDSLLQTLEPPGPEDALDRVDAELLATFDAFDVGDKSDRAGQADQRAKSAAPRARDERPLVTWGATPPATDEAEWAIKRYPIGRE